LKQIRCVVAGVSRYPFERQTSTRAYRFDYKARPTKPNPLPYNGNITLGSQIKQRNLSSGRRRRANRSEGQRPALPCSALCRSVSSSVPPRPATVPSAENTRPLSPLQRPAACPFPLRHCPSCHFPNHFCPFTSHSRSE